MEYAREQIIKSIEALRNYCLDTRCEDCEFSVNNEKCKLDGLPANWCIPARHPSKKKIVPFNFSLEEDRKVLMGKVIRKESKSPYCIWETMVTSFNTHGYHEDWHVVVDNGLMQISAKELLDDWTFVDTGKPVGKEVIE